jgi:hypothetical protein
MACHVAVLNFAGTWLRLAKAALNVTKQVCHKNEGRPATIVDAPWSVGQYYRLHDSFNPKLL